MGQHNTQGMGRLMERVDYHVDRLVTQCERFERMADRLEPWAQRWSTDELAAGLHDRDTPRKARERRLVTLALKGTAAAGRVIREYEPAEHSGGHPLFCRVVRIEWEHRYRNDETSQVA